jgi:transcription elongation factor/antiterminator RfaH
MNVERAEDVPRWYVVHTNPKQEERANHNLTAWGVETLNPKLRTRRFNQFTGQPSYVLRPLFPRYIFAKFNAREQLSKIWFTRGVREVVTFGGKPASIDEDIIQLIHQRIDKNGFVKIDEDLKRGDKVVIKAGPLKSFMGVFERELKPSDRIVVLLTSINYQGRLIVGKDLVERVPG